MATSAGSWRFVGIALSLAGPGVIAWASNQFAERSGSLEVRAIGLLAFSALIAIVAVVAWRAERLSWVQVGLGQMSWATPLRAAALTLFCVAVLGPVAIWMLNELGLQPFDVARLQFVGLPTWYLVTAIVIVAAGEEWLYRGYAIERLEAVTGNAWTAGGISLALFAVAHLPLWGWGVALTTLVSGSIFTVLYIRYRDVAFLMVAHVLTDLYGLVIAPLHR
jgi:membrane protease YdiL (CAAX protease family)